MSHRIERPAIQWNRAKMMEFRAAINAAEEGREDVFTFRGRDYTLSFAKYLLEYLEALLGITV